MGKSAAVLLFASFLFAALLGPAAMTPAGGHAQSDCPFSSSGSLCAGTLPGTLHHLSAFGAFLAVTVAPFAALTLLFMLITAVVFTFLFRPLLLPPPRPALAYNFLPWRPPEAARWLSLHEHSPTRA